MRDDLFDMPPNVQQASEFRRAHAFDARRVLIARMLLRHIFAVDKDGGAVEVAKANIWKEAVKLSEGDYNYRQLKEDSERILPNLELNFACADSLVDVETARQVAYLHEYSRHAVRELWTLRQEYIEDSSDHAPLQEALALRDKLRGNLREQFEGEALPGTAAFLALTFWPCYFEADGTPRASGGFAGIIGNPPWEAVKPVRKEFARVDKFSMSVVDFDGWFTKKLGEDTVFKKRWDEYQGYYEAYKVYLSRRFVHQGMGDWNLFKLFIENNLRLLRDGGRLSLLVPSAIQTDEGCSALRKMLILENTFEEITSFENRGYQEVVDGGSKRKQLFPDVHPQFKFGFFKATKAAPRFEGYAFDARFYLNDPANVFQSPIKYSVEMMRRFSPQNLSFMEFRSEADYELYSRIRGSYPLLGELNFVFRRELHMTGDSGFFQKREGRKIAPGELALYEGKMIHQFDASFKPSTWIVREEEVRPQLLRKEIYRITRFVSGQKPALLEGKPLSKKKDELEQRLTDIFTAKGFRLQYELPRLTYREVGRSTDERTLIAAEVASGACLAHTLMYLNPYFYEIEDDGTFNQRLRNEDEAAVLLTLFNSLVLNYYIRSKVSAHVSIFQLNELPIPPLDTRQRERLAKSAGKLSRQPDDLKERAALEAFIGREVYGLDAEDWRHLTGTFTFGGDSESKADLDEIIRLSTALSDAM